MMVASSDKPEFILVPEIGADGVFARRRGRPRKSSAFLQPDLPLLPPLPHNELAEITAQVHSGLCQTALPHSRPASNTKPWERRGIGTTLIIQPGTARLVEGGERVYVGVPYGSRARLIMIYIQTCGLRSKTVPLGASMSGWIRSLGLNPSGGPRGNIGEIKEQILRLANCQMILEVKEQRASGIITREQRADIARGLQLWASAPGQTQWPTEIELDAEFHAHLVENHVTLDRAAVASLSGSTLGLDIYASFAHWLPRLKSAMPLDWSTLVGAFGSESEANSEFSRRLRKVMPVVLKAYPAARVDITRNGIVMMPSPPPVITTKLGYSPALEGEQTPLL